MFINIQVKNYLRFKIAENSEYHLDDLVSRTKVTTKFLHMYIMG